MKKNRFNTKVFKEMGRLYWNEGYDQADIAAQFKCDQGSVSRILNGLMMPVDERRALKKQLYAPKFKAPTVEVPQAKTLRCKREELHSTKLNVARVKEIRRAYFAGEKDQEQLAALNEVNQSTICRILKGDKWKVCKC